MIRVDRGDPPDGFAERSADWQNRFAEARQRNPELTANQFWTSIRRHLREDADHLAARFHGKCAFCEARPEPCSSPQVEHYRPKSRQEFEHLMFEWSNWLLACGTCNQKKWTRFPDCGGVPCLLDPTEDDPEAHLAFWRCDIVGRTQRGQETIVLVGLDRSPLIDGRAAWLTNIDAALLLAVRVPEAREAAREFLIWSMQEDAPYSAMTRHYLGERTPRLAYPDQPHPRVELARPQEHLRTLVDRYASEMGGLG